MENFYPLFDETLAAEHIPSFHKQARMTAIESYPIFDAPEEQQLNDITKLAALICDTPAALINLLDNTGQWLKPKYGLRIPQTEKCISFCQYTIEQRSSFEVKDTWLNEKFTHHSTIRFYCGVPLLAPEGYPIGCLCVIDFKPKELTIQQKLALETLGKNAATFFELQRQKKCLEEEKKHALSSEKKYRDLVENNQGFICTHDLQGRILSVNPAVCKLLKYSDEELVGKNVRDLLAPKAVGCYQEYISNVSQVEASSGIMHLLSKDGEEYFWEYRTFRFEEEGCEPYIIGSAMDITERHQAKQFLLKSKQELEYRVKERTAQLEQSNHNLLEINKELDTFIYRASHDLRGPLASFLGLCDIALMEFTDDKVRKYFQMISAKAAQANRVLTNLMEVSNIKSNYPEKTSINLNTLLKETASELDFLQETDRTVDIQLECEQDIHVYADHFSLKIICKHILENAMRYKKNNISNPYINIWFAESQQKDLVIVFEDNGVGIPEHLQEKVFDMFCRGDERSKGSGLGLYLVRKAVDKIGGSVHLYSVLGEGTRLEVVLPNQEKL
jgi:PAS domain S-box-containing protein